MRVRVAMDLSRPSTRSMKVRKSGDDWIWITFKYENVTTFCFICGLMGHSEKLCGRLFDTSESDITKPYGVWMRAPFIKQTKLIEEKWLRHEVHDDDRNSGVSGEGSQGYGGPAQPNQTGNQAPKNQGGNRLGENSEVNISRNSIFSAIVGNSKVGDKDELANKIISSKKGVTVVENKKADNNPKLFHDLSLNTELGLESEEEEDYMNVENNNNTDQKNNQGSKNGQLASSSRARVAS